MTARKAIDPTRVDTPIGRPIRQRRPSDYTVAETLGAVGAGLLVLAIAGLAFYRLVTGNW